MRSCWQLAGLGILAMALTACTVNTPAARIDRNPALFAGLPSEQQELVSKGKIARGMKPEAVFLAWGNPHRRSEGDDGGVQTMRWLYAGLRPVYTTGFYGGFGYGGWSGCRGGYSRVAVSPGVTYVPEYRASVLFRDQRVDSWERTR